MKKYLIIFAILFPLSVSLPQNQFQQFVSHVNSLTDSTSKSAAIDSFMVYARTRGIPFITGDSANFIYRGAGTTINLTADYLSWTITTPFINLAGTNFWYYSKAFEQDARIEYRFVRNGNTWLLDPENPKWVQSWNNKNSELAMPAYIQPWEINYNPAIAHGTVIDRTINSTIAGASYQLQIYLPPGYDSLSSTTYPTVYFQDGSEYIDLGSTLNVLDNLLDSNKIQPLIGVFVTPNDREIEYVGAKRFLYRDFFVNELVPYIDSLFKTKTIPLQRLVMGDSYGGNISALISYTYPEVFGNCGLHSAEFKPFSYEVYHLILNDIENGIIKDINWSSLWGSYEDDITVYMRRFRDSLMSNGYTFNWEEKHEAHVWGHWRATTDRILIYFFHNIITPVELNTFSAIAKTDAVYLNWSTATEHNNFGFQIERKLAGNSNNWGQIGFVQGSGNSNSPKEYHYTDMQPFPGKYYYRLKQLDNNGDFEYSDVVEVDLVYPAEFLLSQNYPNPFNPLTKISFTLPHSILTEVKVYDIFGSEVATLVNEVLPGGNHNIDFDGRNFASGVYFYKLKAGNFSSAKKMIMLK